MCVTCVPFEAACLAPADKVPARRVTACAASWGVRSRPWRPSAIAGLLPLATSAVRASLFPCTDRSPNFSSPKFVSRQALPCVARLKLCQPIACHAPATCVCFQRFVLLRCVGCNVSGVCLEVVYWQLGPEEIMSKRNSEARVISRHRWRTGSHNIGGVKINGGVIEGP